MTKHTSQPDLPIEPGDDHDHVSGENAAAGDQADDQGEKNDDQQDDEQNPTPAKKDEPAAPAAPPAAPAAPGADVAPAKRGRGRPKKDAPAKKDTAAAAAPGADVAPKAPGRSEQVEQMKALLQLRASAVGSIAMQLLGWAPLDQQEAAAIDAEFEGWTPPPELRKIAVVAMVVLPRASQDNRVRNFIGLGPVAGGDAPDVARAQLAQQRAEMEAAQRQQAQTQAQAQQAAPPPEQPKPTASAAPKAAPAKSYL